MIFLLSILGLLFLEGCPHVEEDRFDKNKLLQNENIQEKINEEEQSEKTHLFPPDFCDVEILQ